MGVFGLTLGFGVSGWSVMKAGLCGCQRPRRHHPRASGKISKIIEGRSSRTS